VPSRRVRVVVVNFNGGDAVARCVDALTALDTHHDVEIVVVDNASSDGSPEALRQRPGVALWPSGSNLGFVANNLALADLEGVDYAALPEQRALYEVAQAAGREQGKTLDITPDTVWPRIVDELFSRECLVCEKNEDALTRCGQQVAGLRDVRQGLGPDARLADDFFDCASAHAAEYGHM